MTTNDVLREVRAAAAKNGLTFKIDKTKLINNKTKRINNKTAYKFIDRETKQNVLSDMDLDMAYNNVCSGLLDCYDKKTSGFDWRIK